MSSTDANAADTTTMPTEPDLVDPGSPAGSALDRLVFTNRFQHDLPADPNDSTRPRQVTAAAYSRTKPTPVAQPSVIAWSKEVFDLLELPERVVAEDRFANVFGGNELLSGMDPYAMVYGGHQFGNWAGQLGDGRAIALGEVTTSTDEHWVLQLKGPGETPFSRRADGRAVLRSSVREFLCSEAMFHLGVPTTRALSLVLTGEGVVRDMFYDGNPEPELGAIVTRVAPSFVRFGNFQIFAARGELDLLRQLVDHTINADFAHINSAGFATNDERICAFFAEVLHRTALLMVEWMRVGFVHGVMNTDNMSILGLTIDYGPYGWLEDFDPNWTPNTTDASNRRYRYGQQPAVAHWNLVQLANALAPLLADVAPLQAAIDSYPDIYKSAWQSTLASKLGLQEYDHAKGDDDLFAELQNVLRMVETDMTIFYRELANVSVASDFSLVPENLRDALYQPEKMTDAYVGALTAWLKRWADRVRLDETTDADRKSSMNRANPKYVLRNYLAQLAIDRANEGDPSGVMELLDVLRKPYDEQPGREEYAAKRPEWARHRAGCSMLSCSS